jgi:hypothetical protein
MKKAALPRAPEWMPESELRDALISERLPHALRHKNLFWINVRQYLQHEHANLPPEDYLRHWRDVYQSCLSEDLAQLRGLSYVSFEDPGKKKVN